MPDRSWRWLHEPLCRSGAFAAAAGMLTVLAALNPWLGWRPGIARSGATDGYSYLKISDAAPGFPHGPVAIQHAQRWPLHWVVGSIAVLVGSRPETIYRWVALILIVATALVVAAALVRMGVSGTTGVVALALAVLSPYLFRAYGVAPGLVADLLFDLSLTVVLLGLLSGSLPIVLGGLAAGAAGRQTMLVAAPAVALWIALAPEWRGDDGRRRTTAAVLALLVPVVVFAVVAKVAAGFAGPADTAGHITIIDTLRGLPGTASDLVSHVAHVAVVVVVPAALLLATVRLVPLRSLDSRFWGSLAVGVAIVLSVLALSPGYGPRLTGMALIPLAIAFAAARDALEKHSAPAREHAAAFALAATGLLILGTLHQTYTVVSTGSAAATAGLQCVVGIGLIAATMLAGRQSPAPAPR